MKHKISGKERILSAARSLMIMKGYRGASIDEICANAEVQKGTFFYHFKNKEGLGAALVEYHLQMGAKMMANAPFLKEPDPFRKLMKYIDFIIKSIDDPMQQGCLLGVFSNEIAGSKKEIQDACTVGFEGWAQQIEIMINEASENYTHDSDVDARELAGYFIASFEGGLILARGTGQVSHIKTSLTHYKNYLKKIILSEK